MDEIENWDRSSHHDEYYSAYEPSEHVGALTISEAWGVPPQPGKRVFVISVFTGIGGALVALRFPATTLSTFDILKQTSHA